MTGNFNMNLLDFEQNKKVHFFNIVFCHSMIPFINTTTKFKTGIIKLYISIVFVADIHVQYSYKRKKERYTIRRHLFYISVIKRKWKLCIANRDSILHCFDTNNAYDKFSAHFLTTVSKRRKLS